MFSEPLRGEMGSSPEPEAPLGILLKTLPTSLLALAISTVPQVILFWTILLLQSSILLPGVIVLLWVSLLTPLVMVVRWTDYWSLVFVSIITDWSSEPMSGHSERIDSLPTTSLIGLSTDVRVSCLRW